MKVLLMRDLDVINIHNQNAINLLSLVWGRWLGTGLKYATIEGVPSS
jgi:hypothetical protein